jgi:hypothetical protein
LKQAWLSESVNALVVDKPSAAARDIIAPSAGTKSLACD